MIACGGSGNDTLSDTNPDGIEGYAKAFSGNPSESYVDDNVDAAIYYDEDNDVKLLVHVEDTDNIRMLTELAWEEDLLSGYSSIDYNGHLIEIEYPVNIQTLLDNDLIDIISNESSQISINEIIGGLEINIPKELIESWEYGNVSIKLDGEPYLPTVIDDDPVIQCTIPESDDSPYINGYLDLINLSVDDYRCVSYNSQENRCDVINLDNVFIKIIDRNTYDEDNFDVYDDFLSVVEGLYTGASILACNFTPLSTAISIAIDQFTSRTELFVAQPLSTYNDNQINIYPDIDYIPSIVYSSPKWGDRYVELGLTMNAFKIDNDSTFYTPNYISDPSGDLVRFFARENMVYIIMNKTPLNILNASFDTLIDMSVEGGSWFRGKKTQRLYVRNPIVSDSDLDGVPDHQDQCPNTSIGASVDINGCSGSQTSTDDWIFENSSINSNDVITLQAIRNRTEYAYMPVNWHGNGDASISFDVRTTSGFSYAEYIKFGIFPEGFINGTGLQGEPMCYLQWGYSDGLSMMQTNVTVEGSPTAGMNPPTGEWYTYIMDYNYAGRVLTIDFVNNSGSTVWSQAYNDWSFDFSTSNRLIGFFSYGMNTDYGNPSETIEIKNLTYSFQN
jgi:hypothetical protein